MSKKISLALFVLSLITIIVPLNGAAEQYTIGGKPLDTFFYVSQVAGFSLHDERYWDTEKGLQTALMTLFAEATYKPRDDLKLFASLQFNADWAYEINRNRTSWKERQFNKADDDNFVDNEYWQMLNELHLSWTTDQCMFRIGKQIVKWGEMVGFRLMDQINPEDMHHGIGDVEFETSIIPIWLVRAEYWPKSNFGFEFIFNPNADFIPNLDLKGNQNAGIYGPNLTLGKNVYVTPGETHIKEPDEWSDGHEFGLRIKGNAYDTNWTLNGWYGIADMRVGKDIFGAPPILMTGETMPDTLLIPVGEDSIYPRFKFIGGTLAREFPALRASFLGGVSPIISLEALYAFNSTYVLQKANDFMETDEIRIAMSVDWKIDIPFLNDKKGFSVMPAFYYHKYLDYPSGDLIKNHDEKEYTSSVLINTQYMNSKLTPALVWVRAWNNRSNMYILKLSYDYSYRWSYTIGAILPDGEEQTEGFEIFENKDQIYLKVVYKWS